MALTKITNDGVDFSGTTDINIDSGTLVVDASTNRVGVGTTTPQTKFVVSNGGAQGLEIGWDGSTSQFLQAYNRSGSTWIPIRIQGSDIRFNISGSTNEKARIDSSGRLLVGTSSARAQSFSANYTAQTQFETTDAFLPTLLTCYNGNDASPNRIVLGKSRGTTAGAVTAVQEDDEIAYISFQGADGTHLAECARIAAAIDGEPVTGGDASDMPGRLVFSTTADGSHSVTERMRIDSSGRVGIGTTSPTDVLHINSSSTQLKLQSSSGVNNCILHTNGTTDSWRVGMNLSLTNGSYEIYDDVNNVDRMVITSGGNVGIGTTSPDVELHVHSTSQNPAVEITRGSVGSEYGYALYGADGATTPALRFFTIENGSGTGEKARFDSSGRLLVGTSSAAGNNILQLEGSASGGTEWAGISLRRGIASGSLAANQYLGAIAFQSQGGGEGAVMRGVVESSWTGSSHPSRLTFETTASGSSSTTERLRIASTGAFGLSGANYGTSGQVLTSNGSSSAPSWQDASGGKVLQVTSGTKTSRSYFNTSTGWLDSGLSATITPSSTAHKVLVHFSISIGSSGGAEGRVRLLRGSTAIMVGDDSGNNDTEATGFYDNHGSDEDGVTIAGSFLDSPSTTSATTYKMQIYSMSGNQFSVAGNVAANNNIINTRSACSIVLMEIDD